MEDLSHSKIGSWRKLLGQSATEMVLLEPGKDTGLLPINSLLMQFEEFLSPHAPPASISAAVANARTWIDQLFETTALFDEPTIARLREWQTWMQTAVDNWSQRRPGASVPPQWESERAKSETVSASDSKNLPSATTSASSATVTQESGTKSTAASTEPAVHLQMESDADLLREFVSESQEHLDNIERGVLVFEENPADADTLNAIFRAFHTFKGGSGMLKLTAIQNLAHELESLLDAARHGELQITSDIIDLILAGGDALRQFNAEIDAQLSGRAPAQAIVIPTLALIHRARVSVERARGSEESTAAGQAPSIPPSNVLPRVPPGVGPGENPTPAGETHGSTLGIVRRCAPPSVQSENSAAKSDDASSAPSQSTVPKPDAANALSRSASVKVDTHKLDGLIDMVGELVIAQSMVVQDPAVLGLQSQRLSRNLTQLRRITNELQRTTMALRMMPIRGTFHKMARLVRDLGAKQAKKVQLSFSGEETELDRNLVEAISDPLVHMIRNAVDHGVEAPAARMAKGKPAEGNIRLSAFHKGGNIVVQVEDDGAGLNKERIRAKALECGLIQEGAALSDKEIYQLIFRPGFSTAEVITDMSGRGVGMDVVLRNVEKLRGKVEIDSNPGQGTRFTIHLPLTLAIIDGLIVGAGTERYILPALSVRESFRPTREMVSTVCGRGEVVNVRGRLTPLLRLYEHFEVKPLTTDPAQAIFIVVESGEQTRCLMVDELLGKQEVVIKSLSESLGRHRALAGAAILGDGRVGLILNVDALVNLNSSSMALAA